MIGTKDIVEKSNVTITVTNTKEVDGNLDLFSKLIGVTIHGTNFCYKAWHEDGVPIEGRNEKSITSYQVKAKIIKKSLEDSGKEVENWNKIDDDCTVALTSSMCEEID